MSNLFLACAQFLRDIIKSEQFNLIALVQSNLDVFRVYLKRNLSSGYVWFYWNKETIEQQMIMRANSFS